MVNIVENMTPNGVGKLAMDSASDLSDATEYAKRQGFKLGTTLVDASTGDVYMMKSDGTFVKW